MTEYQKYTWVTKEKDHLCFKVFEKIGVDSIENIKAAHPVCFGYIDRFGACSISSLDHKKILMHDQEEWVLFKEILDSIWEEAQTSLR